MTKPRESAEGSAEKPLNVWIVEDNAPYRNSLSRVVGGMVGHENLRAFSDCEGALAALPTGRAPEALLLDLDLPGMGGLEALPRFKSLAPATRIIILTSFDDHDRIAKAICAGAAGYLLKSTELSRVTSAIHEALAGGAPMTPSVASVVLTMFAQASAAKNTSPEYGLTPRERETLEGMVGGLTAKAIAARMNVSYHTVDTHVRNIYEKLGVQSRGGAVAKAVRERLF
jgi:DNA-binding NarL/FixJ family response regulator